MRSKGLVIAIDGPSGAGKSTIATLLAKRIGYTQIDTGAMYRAIACLLNRSAIELLDSQELEKICTNADIRLDYSQGTQRVFANGEDVTELIRKPEMSLITSQISALRPVREAMTKLQRHMGENGGVVLEGRDIGTAVFPDAELKFFLFASTQERAKRRFEELIAKGEKVTLAETVDAVEKRDRQDSERDIAPLRQAEDAIAIDSSKMNVEEVLKQMEAAVIKKRDKVGKQI